MAIPSPGHTSHHESRGHDRNGEAFSLNEMAVPNDLQILQGSCIEQQPEKDDILLMVQTSGDDQLRSVVYPIIYRFFFASNRWLFQISEPSTVSTDTLLKLSSESALKIGPNCPEMKVGSHGFQASLFRGFHSLLNFFSSEANLKKRLGMTI